MKKGFTLIEVTAVILLLSLLTLITVPKIKSIIASKKEAAYNSIVSTIENAAKTYTYMNTAKIDSQIESNGKSYVPLYILIENKLIENKIINPITNEEILPLSSVAITKNGENYSFNYNSNLLDEVNLTLNLDGGSSLQVLEENYIPSSTITLEIPTRENYEFAGWRVIEGNSIIIGNTLIIGTQNTEIIALWTTYIRDGLIVWYDGINNTDSGHNNSSTIWKDLSGNNRDGTLNGATWGTNYLNFDGVDDWVSIGLLNQNIYTIEIIASQNEIVSGSSYTICNIESGGYGLIFKDGYMNNITYIDEYKYCSNSNVSNIDSIEAYSGTYNNVNTKLFKNGILINQVAQTGNIGVPKNDTIMAIGTNPTGISAGSSGFFNGKIYSVRIYDRALTDEEIQNNYDVDKIRYELD